MKYAIQLSQVLAAQWTGFLNFTDTKNPCADETCVRSGESNRGPIRIGYSAFIPTGRTFDPDTGEGWEGVGVKPDIVVTADNALDEALKLAGVNQSGEAALAALK